MSLRLAHALAGTLEGMEERGVAHCDLSGPNLLLPALATRADEKDAPAPSPDVELVDVEQLFGPGLEQPTALPAGSPGYAHKLAPRGLWQATADRFAGALMIAEILAWHDERAREASWGESFFDPEETQEETERYRLMRGVLAESWGEEVADLFDLAWTSERLTDCPTFGEWLLRMPSVVAASSEVAKDEGPAAPDDTTSNVASAPISERSQAELLIEAGRAHQRRGEVDAALSNYREASSLLDPNSDLSSELAILIANLQVRRQHEVEELFDEAITLRLDGNLRAAKELLVEVERRQPGYEADGLPARELLADLDARLAAPSHFGLPIADFGLEVGREEATTSNPQSAIRNPQSPDTHSPIPDTHSLVEATPTELAPIADHEPSQEALYSPAPLPDQAEPVVPYVPEYEAAPPPPSTPPVDAEPQEAAVSWQPPSAAPGDDGRRAGWVIPVVVVAALLFFGTIALFFLMAQSGPGSQAQPTPTALAQLLPSATRPAQVQPTTTRPAQGEPTSTRQAEADPDLLKTFKIEGSSPHNFAISPDGELIASVEYGQAKPDFEGATFHLALWRAEDGELVRQSEDYHLGDVYVIAFSPDGQTVATASGDALIKLWNAQDATLIATLEGHEKGVRALAFSPDGETLASGSEDGRALLWSLPDGELQGALVDGGFILGNVENLAFSPDGQTIAAAAHDPQADVVNIRLWNLSDRKLITKYEGGDWRTTLIFTPDGNNLLIGNNEEESYIARLIRASDGTAVTTYQDEGASGGSSGAALSRDGQKVAVVEDSTGELTLFNADGELLREIRIEGVAGKPLFAPDGRSVAVAVTYEEDENEIQFWNVP
jgi:Tol biopolymer transport system component